MKESRLCNLWKIAGLFQFPRYGPSNANKRTARMSCPAWLKIAIQPCEGDEWWRWSSSNFAATQQGCKTFRSSQEMILVFSLRVEGAIARRFCSASHFPCMVLTCQCEKEHVWVCFFGVIWVKRYEQWPPLPVSQRNSNAMTCHDCKCAQHHSTEY